MSIPSLVPSGIVAAPMAGGPSTPALVKAVGGAGGFGFLASGNVDAAQLSKDMKEASGAAYGVNFFMPQEEMPRMGDVVAAHQAIEPLFIQAGIKQPGIPQPDLTNGYAAKFQAVMDAVDAGYGPAVVSSSFGCFTVEDISVLHAKGIQVWASVTGLLEAKEAVRRGVDALIVQGHEAGGHRLTWSIAAQPNENTTAELVVAVAQSCPGTPLVAAGGVRTAQDVADLRALPHVYAVSCGTAFLLAHESGISAFNRMLLRRGGETVASRAFSGRVARGLKTPFTDSVTNVAPIYPHLGQMLKPLRGQAHTAYCLVGVNNQGLKTLPAAEIVKTLAA